MRKIAFVLLIVLAGCTTAAITVPTCPPLVSYTVSEQTHAAAELAALPQESVVKRMVEDYGELRKQCRALKI